MKYITDYWQAVAYDQPGERSQREWFKLSAGLWVFGLAVAIIMGVLVPVAAAELGITVTGGLATDAVNAFIALRGGLVNVTLAAMAILLAKFLLTVSEEETNSEDEYRDTDRAVTDGGDA